MDLRTRAVSSAAPIQTRPRRSDLPKTFPANRRCKKAGCITRLNRYHPGERCYVHEDGRSHEPTMAELMAAAPAPA